MLLYPASLAVFSRPLRPPAAQWWGKEEEGVEEGWWEWWRSRRSISRGGILIPPFVSPVVMRMPPSLPASDKPQGENNLPVHTLVKLHCSRPLGVHPNSIVHHRRLLFFFFFVKLQNGVFYCLQFNNGKFFFSPTRW